VHPVIDKKRDPFCARAPVGKGGMVVQASVVYLFDHGPQSVLHNAEVQQHSAIIKLWSCGRHKYLVVVAMELFTLAMVTGQEMGSSKTVFYPHSVHAASIITSIRLIKPVRGAGA